MSSLGSSNSFLRAAIRAEVEDEKEVVGRALLVEVSGVMSVSAPVVAKGEDERAIRVRLK